MNSGPSPVTRRSFLKSGLHTSALAAGAALAPNTIFGGMRQQPPSERLNIACVGVGGRGGAAVEELMEQNNIVALCDVDEKRARGSFEKLPKAKRFQDYRVMLDKMDNEIDAVTVSTPDHMHFPIAMAAIAMGKHVFVEKPLAHTVWEARQMRLAAKKAGVATQMGNQGHANEGTRLMREWVQAGAIGAVREVHHWTDRPIWPQGIGRPDSDASNKPPEGLDWDLWLGVAQERPYDAAYAPFSWRGWWDFGTGALGDMGCHIMDSAYWALDLGAPVRVEAVSTPINGETAPLASVVTYHFPARGEQPPVKVVWHDGGLKPSIPVSLKEDRKWDSNGTVLIGDDACLLSNTYSSSVRIAPEAKMREFMPKRPEKSIPRIKGGHFNEWITACKGGTPAGSNFEYSGPLTEAVLLGNVALRSGRALDWDAKNLRVTNYEPANAFITKEYRSGWKL